MDVISKKLQLTRTTDPGHPSKSESVDPADKETKIESTDCEAGTKEAGAKSSEACGTAEQSEGSMPDFLQAREVYYALAHSNRVHITTQPHLLTNVRLTEHQMVGLNWLYSLHENDLNGILADEMGLGKTIQTISLLAQLKASSRTKRRRSLIVAPLSVLAHWAGEIAAKCPSLSVAEIRGSQAERYEQYRTNRAADVLLIQYDTVIRDMESLCALAPFDYVIVDEAQRLKNANCRLAQCLRKIKAAHRLLLTGTPLSNHVEELWALLNFLLPGVFDENFSFGDWFKRRDSDEVDWTPEERALIISRLHSVLRPFFLRRTKSILAGTLPPKTEVTICCPLTPLQRHFIDIISCRVTPPAQSPLRRLSRSTNPVIEARKVCNHPFLIYDDPEAIFSDVQIESKRYQWVDALMRMSGKFRVFDATVQLLVKAGHRVLVFSQFTSTLDLLGDVLDHRKLSWVRLDGASSLDDRNHACEVFQKEGRDVFLLSTRAGGLGLNLQSADTVIMFDSDYNPQQDLQAKARAYRLGQKKHVSVLTLVSDCSLEQHILHIAKNKLEEERRLIGEGRFDGEKITKTDRDKISASLLQSLRDTKEGSVHLRPLANLSELPTLIGRDPSDVTALKRVNAAIRGSNSYDLLTFDLASNEHLLQIRANPMNPGDPLTRWQDGCDANQAEALRQIEGSSDDGSDTDSSSSSSGTDSDSVSTPAKRSIVQLSDPPPAKRSNITPKP